MESRGDDGSQDLGSQLEQKQYGMPSLRVVGDTERNLSCGSLSNPSSACVPGLLPLSQTSSAGGVPVPTYSEMHPADPINISDCQQSQSSASPVEGQSGIASPPQTGKKTKGRVKIKMEYIDNKLRRYTTFSKRKTGIMKKAYELSTLTGTQVMLLVASETGHVYTFATRKLQPMITSEAGKALIQTCLNSPDPEDPGSGDQRMSAAGFEETEFCYSAEDQLKQEGGSEGVSSPELDGGRDSALSGAGEPAIPAAPAPAADTAAATDWPAAREPLPGEVLLINNPTSVIRRVSSEQAGEPPAAAEPTDLSKSRVTLIAEPGDEPPGRA